MPLSLVWAQASPSKAVSVALRRGRPQVMFTGYLQARPPGRPFNLAEMLKTNQIRKTDAGAFYSFSPSVRRVRDYCLIHHMVAKATVECHILQVPCAMPTVSALA